MPHKCTRLNLNWQLKTKQERTSFIQSYLTAIPFAPDSDELEMMGKYILWGTTPETGLNGRQEGLELETAAHTWDTKESKSESLDALLESPTFTESLLKRPTDPIYKTPKLQFSRSEARALATPTILSTLEQLWIQIDRLELLISFYDLDHSKRTTPIRQSLLDRFTPEAIESIKTKSSKLTITQYLRAKHSLVEFRSQQYTYKDTYKVPILSTPTWTTSEPDQFNWLDDIDVLPLGLPVDSDLSEVLFSPGLYPDPTALTESQLESLSRLLWAPRKHSTAFDFSNPDHLDALISLHTECAIHIEETKSQPQNSQLNLLLRLFDFYVSISPLKDFQHTILQLKIKHKSNEEISKEILAQYGKKYSVNYISTLYHQTILKEIAATALRHREVCENLFYPENFKVCIDCGRNLLRDNENFMHKQKIKDGFDCRCKACAKILRDRRNKK